MIDLIINGKKVSFEKGTKLLDIVNLYQKQYKTPIIGAYVNNILKDLHYEIKYPCKIEFIDLTYKDGERIYIRTLSFIFNIAIEELYPSKYGEILHSISDGLFCVINDRTHMSNEVINNIKAKMQEIIDKDITFEPNRLSSSEVTSIFIKTNREHMVDIIENEYINKRKFYKCGRYVDCYFGPLAPSTKYIHLFDLISYQNGAILRFPLCKSPLKLPEYKENLKLFNSFKEHKEWGKITGIENIGMLNKLNKEGKIGDVIRISEALQEKKVAQIADEILRQNKRIILIAGPSSSGKTTFSQRLAIQLKVNGLKPVLLSLDNYFIDRDDIEIDENGERNFEDLNAIDVEDFNKDLNDLINGCLVTIPKFDFNIGKRIYDSKNVMKIDKTQPIIIEGIHGLNEKLTPYIDKKNKFKIYISALTSLSMDEHNRIPTTDTRLIRRIVRDNAFRNYNATNTIQMWNSVRIGEDKNIFPFQNEADAMFNSAMVYELGVLKIYAEPLLEAINQNQPEYPEARRLLNLLKYFLPIRADEVPINSILREFIGNGCFER